jgi:hypothetical protein
LPAAFLPQEHKPAAEEVEAEDMVAAWVVLVEATSAASVEVISAALTEVASAVSVEIASMALAPIIWRAWTTITSALDDVASGAAT